MKSQVLALITGILCSGCFLIVEDHDHPHGMPPGQAKKVACHHHAGCNHVFADDDYWMEVYSGHNHGSGCGHLLIDGIWWVEGKGKAKEKGKGKH